ncbi:hypothetical protein AB2Z22_000415 [Clostridium botulinum]
MDKQVFYTIQREDGSFIPNNLFLYKEFSVTNAVKFRTLEDAKDYKLDLRKDKVFKIIEVNCSFKDVEDK